jgi:signal transduction histidine kinase
MAAPSDYVLEPLREGADFAHCRGRQRGNRTPVLAIALSSEQPSPQNLTPRMLLLYLVFFLFTISPVGALDTSRHLSQYGHTAWRLEDGVFAGAPNVIAQTADGYLWIGTQAGLTRFDGVRFVSWKPPEGKELPSSRINSLLGARDGSLWIGTTMGLARWRNGELTNYKDPTGSIMAILEDRTGTIWIARANIPDTKGPLCKVTEAGLRCYGRDDGVGVPYGVTLANDSLGNIWLAGGPKVSRWQTSSADTYVSAGLDPAEIFNGVLALAGRPDGSLWVGLVESGKGGGLQQLAQGAWKPFVTPEFDGSALEVTALLLDRDSTLWVGTLNQGIYRIQGDKVDHFRSSDGLSGDAVTGLFQDRELNIWIATSRGIDNFHDLRVVSFSTRQGLSSDQVNSVLASRDGAVWIGNYNLDVLRSGKITSIQPRNRLPGRRLTSLLEDRAGRLWVGVDYELSVYEGGNFTKIHPRDGGPLGAVRAMTEDVDGSIWVATNTSANRHRLFRIQDLRIREEISSPQLPAINTIAPDPHGGAWLGLAGGGLARFRNGQMEFVPFSGLHDGPVNGLLVNSDASILAATPSGLVGWRNGTLQTLTVRNGLPCDVMYTLISDRKATLWLYAACGVIAIPNAELQRWWKSPDATVKSRLFDVFDGARPMSTPFQPNASPSPDGRLWFANQNVVQMIDPAHLDNNPILPPVHVEEMIADHKNYAPREGLRLPALTRNLEIDYTALSFVAPQKVRFRYKLEGYDSEWQDPGTRRQAFYADLRPENYRFRVIACNNDGIWNEEGATLAFSVAAAWYQTWWFRGASLAVFLALLWALYQLRLHQLAHQFNITLEARVNERTRIARDLHDTLLQSFQALLYRLQSVRRVLPDRPEEAAQRLDSAIDQTAQAITEGRDAVHELRSSTVVANDLAQAIGTLGEDLAAQPNNHHAAVFGVQVEGTPRSLHPILRDEVFRIAGEAMRNAFRHAGAKQIEVEIRYDDRQFRMRIRDDGRGIDPKVLIHDGQAGHYGLHGMRERAKLVGGRLDVWSELDSGTEVELSIPATIAYSGATDRSGSGRSGTQAETES